MGLHCSESKNRQYRSESGVDEAGVMGESGTAQGRNSLAKERGKTSEDYTFYILSDCFCEVSFRLL